MFFTTSFDRPGICPTMLDRELDKYLQIRDLMYWFVILRDNEVYFIAAEQQLICYHVFRQQ